MSWEPWAVRTLSNSATPTCNPVYRYSSLHTYLLYYSSHPLLRVPLFPQLSCSDIIRNTINSAAQSRLKYNTRASTLIAVFSHCETYISAGFGILEIAKHH